MTTDIGDPYPITVETRDENGALIDTTTVTVVITLPDGTDLAPASMTRTTVGRYEYDYVTTVAGLHEWEAEALGAIEGVFTDTFTVTSSSEVGIVGLQEARAHLNLVGTDDDEILRAYILTASDLCEAYTGRAWRRTAVVGEVHDGGGAYLQLRRQPVLEVTAATENGAAAADYVLDARRGRLYRGTQTGRSQWLPGLQIVEVTYVAGPADALVPAQIRHGVLECIRHLFEARRGGSAIPQVGAATEWVPVLGYSIPRRVAELWNMRRRPRVA